MWMYIVGGIVLVLSFCSWNYVQRDKWYAMGETCEKLRNGAVVTLRAGNTNVTCPKYKNSSTTYAGDWLYKLLIKWGKIDADQDQ